MTSAFYLLARDCLDCFRNLIEVARHVIYDAYGPILVVLLTKSLCYIIPDITKYAVDGDCNFEGTAGATRSPRGARGAHTKTRKGKHRAAKQGCAHVNACSGCQNEPRRHHR
jgi:hypothetical protein